MLPPQAHQPAAWWFWLRLAVGLGLLCLSLRPVNWGLLGAQLTSAHWDWMALAVFSVLVSTGLKIARWGWLCRKCGIGSQLGWARLSAAFLVGQAANVVLPFRGGDLARIGWFAAQEPADTLPVTISILLEKYADILALLLSLVWLGPFLPEQVREWGKGWLVPLGGVISLSLVILLVAGPWILEKLRGLVGRFSLRWQARLDGLINRYLPPSSFGALRSPRGWLGLAAMTLVVWLVMISTNLCVLNALDLPAGLPAGSLVLALVYLGLAPALMPGNFGPFYFFAMLGLAPFGVDESQRAAFAVALHAVVTLPPVLLAGGFLIASRRPFWRKT